MPEPDKGGTHPTFEVLLVGFEDILNGTQTGRANDEQIVSYGGPGSGQRIQFAAVAGITAQVDEQHDIGYEIPNDWLLQANDRERVDEG